MAAEKRDASVLYRKDQEKMKKDLESIKQRNKRVEADKAWETSKTRRAVIAVLTYFIVVIFLCIINAPHPWLSAIVPVIGYILSTMLLGPLKTWWLKNIYKKR
jgi:hypothetical protein